MQKRISLSLCFVLGILSEVSFGLVITGQVVDTQAQPIQDAEVVVCERYAVSSMFQDANLISPIVKTDVQGRFVFELDSALSEDVGRQRNIFVMARKAGQACAWEWLNTTLNTYARRDFPLVLEPAAELMGQVVDTKGNPVQGAEVQALPTTYSGFPGLNDNWRTTGPKAWFSATTDAQGRFRFNQMSENANASLRVTVPDSQNRYDFTRGPCDLHGFWVGQTDIRLKLPAVGRIAGQVRDHQGRPVAAVDVEVFLKQHPVYRYVKYKDRMTRSDTQGFFTFDAIPEGSHWIDVCGHGKDLDAWVGQMVAISVKAGQTAKRTMRVTKGGMYEVTVKDAQTGYPFEGLRVGIRSEVWARHRSITDAQGRTRIRALPGSHSMYVGGDRVSLWQTSEMVRSGQTVRVEALVDVTPKVTGIVVDAENKPVAQVLVIVRGGDHVLTDAAGRFSAYGSKKGSAKAIWIVARDREHDRAALQRVTELSTPITLKLKPVRPITGQVADPQGKPVCAARVNLDSKASNGTRRMDERVLTDRQGRFTLKAIPPRQRGFDYRLYINAIGYGPANSIGFETREQGGESQDIGSFTLIPTSESVTGYVVNTQGVPAPGASVYVNSVGGVVPQYHNGTATDEQGRFYLPHLCQGAIRIEVTDENKRPIKKGTLTLQVPAENVKIVLGKDLYHDATISLLGKSLPEQAVWSKDMVQGKPVLLCFVDIEQRPSRRCLSELAQKKEYLASNGVTLVVVQVSQIDLAPYAAFLKADHIDMPIRMLEQDFETKKLEWGVKGLPWLILTDKAHVIVGEGLSVEEGLK